ncbi:hypothetical protein H2200_007880 [Cladophialophora chaetospira]|uniref:Uncharacterized protein n=1 Tax=Cladophialophora chaetospira TaxID=386627 RepID=A0AA38X713_9EURO|nr:hypothetical protein H2200_007880 [Cladophialophora chaetospira]
MSSSSSSESLFENATPGSFSDFPGTAVDVFVETEIPTNWFNSVAGDAMSDDGEPRRDDPVTVASLRTEAARSAFVLAYTALDQGKDGPKRKDIVSALQTLGHIRAVAKAIVQGAMVLLKYRAGRDIRFEAIKDVKSELESILDDINKELELYAKEEQWKTPQLEVHGSTVLLAKGEEY